MSVDPTLRWCAQCKQYGPCAVAECFLAAKGVACATCGAPWHGPLCARQSAADVYPNRTEAIWRKYCEGSDPNAVWEMIRDLEIERDRACEGLAEVKTMLSDRDELLATRDRELETLRGIYLDAHASRERAEKEYKTCNDEYIRMRDRAEKAEKMTPR